MSYSVKEIYLTLQGEGFHTGKHAVFCRFSGCNLWTGLEKDREKAICNFCDTDFVGTDGINGGKYSSADKLANKIDELWEKDSKENFNLFKKIFNNLKNEVINGKIFEIKDNTDLETRKPLNKDLFEKLRKEHKV